MIEIKSDINADFQYSISILKIDFKISALEILGDSAPHGTNFDF